MLFTFGLGVLVAEPPALAAKNERSAARKKAKGGRRTTSPPARPPPNEPTPPEPTPATTDVKAADARDGDKQAASQKAQASTAPAQIDEPKRDGPTAVDREPQSADAGAKIATAPQSDRIGLSFSVHGGALAMLPARDFGVTWSVGGEVRERFPFLRRTLALAVAFDFFEPASSAGGTSQRAGGDIDYRVSLRAFQLSADLLVFLPLGLPIDFYAGGGYSAFFFSANESAFGVDQSELQLRHGFRARLGIEWPFHRLLFLAIEAVYHYATVAFRITGPLNVGALQGRLVFGVEL